MNESKFVVCNCNVCSGSLEFDRTRSGETIQCPHCGMDTILFVPFAPKEKSIPEPAEPATPAPPPSNAPAQKPTVEKPQQKLFAALFIFTTVCLASILIWEHLAKHDAAPQARVAQSTNSQAVVLQKDALATGQLMDAVESGDLKRVKVLLKANPKLVFSKDSNGRTPLDDAAFNGFKDVAALLLANKADVNAKDIDGVTPLHRAAGKGRKDVAELLLANGANVNARDNKGETPLFWADEYKDVAELLLAKGAEVNVRNEKGETPLFIAARDGDKKVVEVLLENKADVNVKDGNGDTPLHVAALLGEMDVAELLLAYRADVNATNDHGYTPMFTAALHKDMEELLRQHGGHE